jgi:hybrid cluster-associated redox disulfide protein
MPDFSPQVCASAKKPLFSWCTLETKEAIMEHPQRMADLTVAEVMARWPQTVPYFFRCRMACVGCPIAPFETLAEATAVYGLDLNRFLIELEWAIQQGEKRT